MDRTSAKPWRPQEQGSTLNSFPWVRPFTLLTLCTALFFCGHVLTRCMHPPRPLRKRLFLPLHVPSVQISSTHDPVWDFLALNNPCSFAEGPPCSRYRVRYVTCVVANPHATPPCGFYYLDFHSRASQAQRNNLTEATQLESVRVSL